METFSRPRGKIVTQLPRIYIFFIPFSLLFQFNHYLYLGESSLIIKTVQWEAPLTMVTDVFFHSFSPIPRICNGPPCSAKMSLYCGVNFHVIFLFGCFSHECRQISCWDPFVTTPSSSEGEGMEESRYIWLLECCWERCFWSILFDLGRRWVPLSAVKCCDTVFQMWLLASGCSSSSE